jgi:hypothetical protein
MLILFAGKETAKQYFIIFKKTNGRQSTTKKCRAA